MAIYSGFFGGPEGEEPEYTQPQFAAVLAKLFSNGIVKDFENEFAVSENDPISLSVIAKSGWGWIKGYWIHNTDDAIKTLGAADPDNPRIDRIVLRLDTTEGFEISIEVLEGTPAADPDPPELTQTAAIYEISLAQVLVGAAVTSVSNTNITDEREYAGVGGIDLSLYVTLVGAEILTNKRITKRVGSVTSSASLTIDADSYDVYCVTALGQALTINAPSGTPTNGQALIIRILDDGTGRALSWNAVFRVIGTELPTTTVASKTVYVGVMWNSADSKWDVLAVGEEA